MQSNKNTTTIICSESCPRQRSRDLETQEIRETIGRADCFRFGEHAQSVSKQADVFQDETATQSSVISRPTKAVSEPQLHNSITPKKRPLSFPQRFSKPCIEGTIYRTVNLSHNRGRSYHGRMRSEILLTKQIAEKSVFPKSFFKLEILLRNAVSSRYFREPAPALYAGNLY